MLVQWASSVRAARREAGSVCARDAGIWGYGCIRVLAQSCFSPCGGMEGGNFVHHLPSAHFMLLPQKLGHPDKEFPSTPSRSLPSSATGWVEGVL